MKKSKNQISRIEKLCAENGVKFTHQRKIIANVISNSTLSIIRAPGLSKRFELFFVTCKCILCSTISGNKIRKRWEELFKLYK